MVRKIMLSGAMSGAALLLMAAGPSPSSFGSGPLFTEATLGAPQSGYTAPQRQQAPADGGFTAAPMPDIDQSAPVQHTLGPSQPQLSAGLFRPQHTYRGEGFVYGSTVQGSQDRRVRPAPSLNLKVPLE